MYGPRGPTYVHHGDVNINVDRSNNVYRGNNGVSTNDVKRNPKQQPSVNGGNKQTGTGQNVDKGQATTGGSGINKGGQNANKGGQTPSNANKNNIATDKQGNVYKQNNQGSWDQRSNSGWQQNNNTNTQQQLNQQQQQRQQAEQRNNSYNQMNQGGNMGGGYKGGNGGGGAKPAGGGGGPRR
jgi:hypothetical protein